MIDDPKQLLKFVIDLNRPGSKTRQRVYDSKSASKWHLLSPRECQVETYEELKELYDMLYGSRDEKDYYLKPIK